MSAVATPGRAAVPLWKVYLRLGRVSNLPTVWTNVVAGVWLSGARPHAVTLVLLAVGMSLFYTGGMFLNDAFDRAIDARERPERPIPAGLVGAGHVFGVGVGLLVAGEALIAVVASLGSTGVAPLLGGAALAGAILFYDRFHKGNPAGPVVMGLCRALVYVTAALAAQRSAPLWPAVWGDVTGPGPGAFVVQGALVGWCYLIGLTYAAKQESLDRIGRLWPLAFLAVPFAYGVTALQGEVAYVAVYIGLLAVVVHAVRLLRGHTMNRFPRAVMALIAGISLLDALLVATAGGGTVAVLLTATGFPATLWLQRWVRGT